MARSTPFVLGALVAVSAAARQLPAQSPDAVVAKASAAWAKVRTLRGSFEQTLVNPVTGATLVSHGEIEQARPNRVSIRFTDPAGDRIVSDGKTLWMYLPSTTPGQVIKQPASRGAGSLDVAGQFLDAPKRNYDIAAAGTATVSGRATHAVRLTPKPGANAPFIRATMWVDDQNGYVRQVEMIDANGLTRKLRFTAVTVNPTIPASTFAFTPPPNARVVDGMR